MQTYLIAHITLGSLRNRHIMKTRPHEERNGPQRSKVFMERQKGVRRVPTSSNIRTVSGIKQTNIQGEKERRRRPKPKLALHVHRGK